MESKDDRVGVGVEGAFHLRSKYRIAEQYIEGEAYIEAELYRYIPLGFDIPLDRYILRIRYLLTQVILRCGLVEGLGAVPPCVPEEQGLTKLF